MPLTGNEDLGVYNPFRIGTRVYLTLPDGGERYAGRVGFTFDPVATSRPASPITRPLSRPTPASTGR